MILKPLQKFAVLLFSLHAALPLFASVSVSLSADQVQPQPVGTTIHWTAAANTSGGGALWYRFAVRNSAGVTYVAKDFSPDATFAWTPSEQEDVYTIEATAMDTVSLETSMASQGFAIDPVVTGENAVVSSTANSLVALYSAPACPAGSAMDVRFRKVGSAASLTTTTKPCTGKSMNFYVGGMYANTDYAMKHEVITGSTITAAPELTFHTGTPNCDLPFVTMNRMSMVPGVLGQSTLLWAPVQNAGEPFATDLQGNLMWCYPQVAGYMPRSIEGGKFFVLFTDGTDAYKNGLAIIDLAGNIVQQTTVPRMNQQLQAAGYAPVTQFHHDARRLPDGDILALTASERILVDKQGPGPVDVVGDMILVLDSDLQLKWVWDSFAHLDVTRRAVLGELCLPGGQSGCPPVRLSSVANDWTHGNSIDLTVDGDIIYSARHQDFIYRIDYKNGSGSGNVIWRLGKGGDFSTDSGDRYPWNSHQHDVEYDGTGLMLDFDNGDTRYELLGPQEQSRGQVVKIDEANRFVHYVMNQPLGLYSAALGTAEALADGNYFFEAGYVLNGFSLTQIAEYTPGGKELYQARRPFYTYRAFRMNSLYRILPPGVDANLPKAADVVARGFIKPAAAATIAAATSETSAAPATTMIRSSPTVAAMVDASPISATTAMIPSSAAIATTDRLATNQQTKPSAVPQLVLTSDESSLSLQQGTDAEVGLTTRYSALPGSLLSLTETTTPRAPGLTVTLSQNAQTSPGPVRVTLAAGAKAVPGRYKVTVTATWKTISKSTVIDVQITGHAAANRSSL